jgi:hypothetical protein
MTQHTPTPWHLLKPNDHSGDCGITALGLPNVLAECFADIRHAGEHSAQEAQANAAHIVKCVNAYEDLVAALKMARKRLTDDGRYMPTQTSPEKAYALMEVAYYDMAIEAIDAALAKAEGK